MRRGIATVVAGLVMVLGGGVGLLWPAQAQDASGGGGVGIYDLNATGSAMREIVDTANNPLPTETFLDVSMEYTVATLSGGSGRGLGSTFWPSDAGANACAAVPEMPCYPIRAESFHPQGPAEESNGDVPGSVMQSKAGEKEAMGLASTAGQGAEVSGTSSNALATVKDGLAIAETTASVQSINLGGQVKIDKVVSVAKAVSDGAKAEVTGKTTVTGLTIGGQPATIDENGVHFAGQGTANPLLPGGPLVPLNDVLKQAGITMTLANPIKTIEGSKGEIVAGGLIITLDNNPFVSQLPPEVMSAIVVPGLGGIPPLGGKITLILGQASASAAGNPGFGDFVEDITAPIEDISAPIEAPPVEDVSGSAEVMGSTDTEPQQLGSSGTRPAEIAQPVAAGRALPAGTPVSAALVILSLVGVGVAAFGLRRLATDVFAVGGTTTCPLETS